MQPLVLAYLDFSKEFLVATDASDLAVGAVLQLVDDTGVRPIAFYSRKLKGPELNWTNSGKETLAQVLALKQWRCYLEGKHFRLQTYHHPLVYLQTQPHLPRKRACWMEHLQQFDFTTEYISGPQSRWRMP